jgi:hypothetical protein
VTKYVIARVHRDSGQCEIAANNSNIDGLMRAMELEDTRASISSVSARHPDHGYARKSPSVNNEGLRRAVDWQQDRRRHRRIIGSR